MISDARQCWPFTKEDLKINTLMYNMNCARLMKYVTKRKNADRSHKTAIHQKLLKIEKMLNSIGELMRDDLGVRVKDPCGTERCANNCALTIEKDDCDMLNAGRVKSGEIDPYE